MREPIEVSLPSEHPRVLSGSSSCPDEQLSIRVRTIFCIFCKKGTVVFHFWNHIKRRGKLFNFCTQGIDESSCEADGAVYQVS